MGKWESSMDENCTISTSVFHKLLVGHCRRSRHWTIFFLRSLDWTSLRKLSAKRTASIIGKRALACSHEHVDVTRRCTTLLCSVFKTSDVWDFWRKVDRMGRPCSLATSFTRSNITRLLFMGFCQRTRNGGNTYHAWRHERMNTPSMYRNYTTNVGWSTGVRFSSPRLNGYFQMLITFFLQIRNEFSMSNSSRVFHAL